MLLGRLAMRAGTALDDSHNASLIIVKTNIPFANR